MSCAAAASHLTRKLKRYSLKLARRMPEGRTLNGERGILRGACLGDSVGAPSIPRSLPAGDRAKGLSTEPALLNLRRK